MNCTESVELRAHKNGLDVAQRTERVPDRTERLLEIGVIVFNEEGFECSGRKFRKDSFHS